MGLQVGERRAERRKVSRLQLSRHTFPVVFGQTQDSQTRFAIDAIGGGRSLSSERSGRLRGLCQLSGIIEKIVSAECSLNGEPATWPGCEGRHSDDRKGADCI